MPIPAAISAASSLGSSSSTPRAASADAALFAINRDLLEEKVEATARELRLPYIDLRTTPINADLLRGLDLTRAREVMALPFFRVGRKIRLAVAEPESAATKAYLAELTASDFEVFPTLASRDGILQKIIEIEAQLPKARETFENKTAEIDLKNYEDEIRSLADLPTDAKHLAAADTLNRLFVGALRTGASDLHIQPEKGAIVVRFRIDGILQEILRFDAHAGAEVVNQLKYEAKLRLNVTSAPQDGRAKFTATGREIDLRVSTLPTEYGESIVCRLLDSERGIISFEQLGFGGATLTTIQAALTARAGLILVTGPTGSGKTTTLYTMLDSLNQSDVKVATLEDPIEYHLDGVVQSQVDVDAGYAFADGLRALLRQDPDVIMVGEIRDRVTAETAAQAAMTGHIVLSTLHTNDAVDTIPRLINLGLPPYLLAESLSLVVAQRLVRRVHTDCARKVVPTAHEESILTHYLTRLQELDPAMKNITVPDFIWQPVGCPGCSHTGYRGQLAVSEVFRMTDDLRQLVQAGADSVTIATHLREKQKMRALAEDGIAHVIAGETTLAEIARTTPLAN